MSMVNVSKEMAIKSALGQTRKAKMGGICAKGIFAFRGDALLRCDIALRERPFAVARCPVCSPSVPLDVPSSFALCLRAEEACRPLAATLPAPAPSLAVSERPRGLLEGSRLAPLAPRTGGKEKAPARGA